LGATTLITLTKTLTKTYEKKMELSLMNEYNIAPSKEDLKFKEDYTPDWGMGDSYIEPMDFTCGSEESEG
jgi:hypothetical protein